MKLSHLTPSFALLLSAVSTLQAGDAVLWNPEKRDFIAEYSATPPGGNDYLNETQAVDSVQKVARKQRATSAQLIWKSDRTGYFAVCTGQTAAGKSVTGIGFGNSEAAAKIDGLEVIRKAGAESELFIAYRYASYGADYNPAAPPLQDLSSSAVVNEEISSISPDGRWALRTAHSRGWKFRRFDLVDLQTFDLALELGAPTARFGSITWSDDTHRFAFFGEEEHYGDTSVFFREDGKYVPAVLPDREKLPEAELGLAPEERVFKTNNDSLRPKSWLKNGDLELQRKLEVVVEKQYEQVATVSATTTMTVHFEGTQNAAIIAVAQETSRKELPKQKKAGLKIPAINADLTKQTTPEEAAKPAK